MWTLVTGVREGCESADEALLDKALNLWLNTGIRVSTISALNVCHSNSKLTAV
jgi:hypothetical protein